MADYGLVTITGDLGNINETTAWFILASTTGVTTTYTLLGSVRAAPNNGVSGQGISESQFAWTTFVPTPPAGTTYQPRSVS